VPVWLLLTLLSTRAGGVKLVNGNNRITLDNTLDERLRLLEDRVCDFIGDKLLLC
jgi:hypothetical protein